MTQTAAPLAARSPKLRKPCGDAKKAGCPFVVLDGTLIRTDRVAADRPFFSGKHQRPRLHEDMVKIRDISARVRHIAVKDIGRDEPTLLITHDLATPAKDLFTRYAERMTAGNELDAYISGFHLDALTSGVSLNVDWSPP